MAQRKLSSFFRCNISEVNRDDESSPQTTSPTTVQDTASASGPEAKKVRLESKDKVQERFNTLCCRDFLWLSDSLADSRLFCDLCMQVGEKQHFHESE